MGAALILRELIDFTPSIRHLSEIAPFDLPRHVFLERIAAPALLR